MSENMLTRDQRLAKLRMQLPGMADAELIDQINFVCEEIKITPSDRHRAQMQDNLSLFAAEAELRGIKLPARA